MADLKCAKSKLVLDCQNDQQTVFGILKDYSDLTDLLVTSIAELRTENPKSKVIDELSFISEQLKD